MVDQSFHFSEKLWGIGDFTEIINDPNCDFWPKFRFLTNILIFTKKRRLYFLGGESEQLMIARSKRFDSPILKNALKILLETIDYISESADTPDAWMNFLQEPTFLKY